MCNLQLQQQVLCIFLEHNLIMVSVRLQMCEEYLNGHQGVHMGQYSVLTVFPFNPFVYYNILSHTRPIITSNYAAVVFAQLHYSKFCSYHIQKSRQMFEYPTINDLFYDQMNNMLLIIVKDDVNIQILFVTHLPYLKHILWYFINVCTYSQLLTTQELSFIINPIRSGLFQTVNDPGGGL